MIMDGIRSCASRPGPTLRQCLRNSRDGRASNGLRLRARRSTTFLYGSHGRTRAIAWRPVMRKIATIALREYQALVRTKAFIISLVVMPVFMFGVIVVQSFLSGRV